MGAMHEDKTEAEKALKELKPHYPTAFIARDIYTPRRIGYPNTTSRRLDVTVDGLMYTHQAIGRPYTIAHPYVLCYFPKTQS